MGADMWLKDDVKNILTGVHLAHTNFAQHFDNPEVRAYRAGFVAALAAAAASFGISPGEVLMQEIQLASPGNHSLVVHP